VAICNTSTEKSPEAELGSRLVELVIVMISVSPEIARDAPKGEDAVLPKPIAPRMAERNSSAVLRTSKNASRKAGLDCGLLMPERCNERVLGIKLRPLVPDHQGFPPIKPILFIFMKSPP
jgi:hypothetical protein